MQNLSTRCFILHTRPFKETSLLLDLISAEFGRFSAIAKGAKRKNSQALRAVLQPFNDLLIEVVGKGELKTLVNAELFSNTITTPLPNLSRPSISEPSPATIYRTPMPNQSLACGYYVNELVIRSLSGGESCPDLFQAYLKCINELRHKGSFSASLRKFELALLGELGITPDLTTDIDGRAICPEKYYYFVEEQGFALLSDISTNSPNKLQHKQFWGCALLALAESRFEKETDKHCQQITQLLLRQVIGQRPLESRKLWV
jgi:DNA repair protein RecO (recombination protein O)